MLIYIIKSRISNAVKQRKYGIIFLFLKYEFLLDKIIEDEEYRVDDCLDNGFVPAEQPHKEFHRLCGNKHLHNRQAEVLGCR